ncbi:MAG: L-seryl-tRNA(Sec) selenium transferase [Chloroflexi bacterium]|nr:L-seryl-tRNA(Sec) selenium transferase [Chloroflexota bacterium]
MSSDSTPTDSRRTLPSVDRLLADPAMANLLRQLPHREVVDLVRQELAAARAAIRQAGVAPSFEDLIAGVARRAEQIVAPTLVPVVNATGVILHTNLGRAPLSEEAARAAAEAALGYSNLEFDLATGERGSRHVHLERLLCRLTGAEAALAVNNNAAAVLLVLTALAIGREVIVSRGQAVEIGGGFRIPDVLRQSGARLVEVGTTNRTYAEDYERAITADTAAILQVHTSNFRVVGFTYQPELAELVVVAGRHGVPVLDDLGSGCLIDPRPFGLAREPLVQESVQAGVSLACFSGDKLLGGPQAGFVVGRRDLVDRLKRHPLVRAIRVDKTTIAAATATLTHYLREEAVEKVPVWRMIAMPIAEITARASRWREALGGSWRLTPGESAIGGGSLPGETLPTTLLVLDLGDRATTAAAALRQRRPAVVVRIERGAIVVDPRTVLPGQDDALLEALRLR